MSKAETIYDKVQALPESAQSAVLDMVESLADSASRDARTPGGPASRFRELAETWRRETGFFSFMQQRALHPAYQRIIGMGWVAVPSAVAMSKVTPPAPAGVDRETVNV